MTVDRWYTKPKRSEEIEQAVGTIWQLAEQGQRSRDKVNHHLEEVVGPKVLGLVLKAGLAEETGADLRLTPEGEALGREITRRHRLAERLLQDLLAVRPEEVDAGACQMEHILSPEVTQAICTLLGHPQVCPHGTPIPQGSCCDAKAEQVEAVVTSLARCEPGDALTIAYVQTRGRPEIQRLMTLGVTPGTRVRLRQTSPSFVLEVEDTQLALEKSLAEHIFVRRA
ncbi:MAG: metal-dependent transcriptional regulator [bacterium]